MRLLLVAVATLIPRVASADESASQPPNRQGITVGISVGAGVISPSCQGCESLVGPAVDFHIGWGFTSRFTLLYDGSAVAHSGDGFGSEMNPQPM